MTGNSRQFDLSKADLDHATVTGLLAASEFKVGDLIAARYRIVKLLGMGGMGVVYLARDEELQVDVALKLLRPELAAKPEAFERFRQELLLARQISSPHVVRIHDIVKHAQVWLISMDYVAGQSLEHVLENEGAQTPERAIQITRDLAEGLRAAHQRDVIHRDLKPANVLLNEAGQAIITDFGVARTVGATGMTGSGVIIGTPEYLSPEQARAEPVDGRSDLYALGLILYELLTGKLPFSGGTPAEMLAQRIVSSPPSVETIKPDLPKFAARLCSKLLELRPSHRFQTAEEVLKAIGAQSIPPLPWRERIKAPSTMVKISAAFLMLAATVFGVVYWQAQLPDAAMSQRPMPSMALAVMPIRVVGSATEIMNRQLNFANRWIGTSLSLQHGADIVDAERVDHAMQALNMLTVDWSKHRDRLMAFMRVERTIELQLNVNANPMVLSAEVWQNGETKPDHAAQMQITETTPLRQALVSLINKSADAAGIEKVQLTAWEKQLESTWPVIESSALSASPASLQSGSQWMMLEALERGGHLSMAQAMAKAIVDANNQDLAKTASRNQSVVLYALILLGQREEAMTLARALQRERLSYPEQILVARAFADAGQFNDAMTVLAKIKEGDEWNVEAWFGLGRYALMSGDAQAAVDDYLIQASVRANRLRDTRMQANVANTMGIAYRELGQYSSSVDQLNAAIKIWRDVDNKKSLATSLRNLGSVFSRMGKHTEASAALEEARQLVLVLGDESMQANLLNEMGVLAEEQGDFRKALQYYRDALGLQQRIGDSRLVGETQANVGFAYAQLGEFDNATVYWEQAKQSFESVQDRGGATRALQGIAMSNIAQGQWLKAKEALQITVAEAENLQLAEARAAGLLGLTELGKLEGSYQSANGLVKTAGALLGERSDLRGEREAALQQISITLETMDLNGAQVLLEKLASMPIDNQEQAAMFALRQSQWHLLRGEAEKALSFAEQAGSLAKKSSSLAHQLSAELLRAEALYAANKPALAEQILKSLRNGFTQYANVPVRLAWLETRMLDRHESAKALWAELQSQLARLTRYGRAPWLYARLAKRADADAGMRTQALAAAAQSLQVIWSDVPIENREALRAHAIKQGIDVKDLP